MNELFTLLGAKDVKEKTYIFRGRTRPVITHLHLLKIKMGGSIHE